MTNYRRHPNFPAYRVYRDGRVISERTGKQLAVSERTTGGHRYTLWNRGVRGDFYVNRLVYEVWGESPRITGREIRARLMG